MIATVLCWWVGSLTFLVAALAVLRHGRTRPDRNDW